jgi:hypothetical protein
MTASAVVCAIPTNDSSKETLPFQQAEFWWGRRFRLPIFSRIGPGNFIPAAPV